MTQSEGLKHDNGKLKWHAMPKVILIPLVQVFVAGLKYGLYNCLKEFKDCDARFSDALDRHLVECQMNPLAKDPEDGCYHSAKVAWYALMRIYHAERAQEKSKKHGQIVPFEKAVYAPCRQCGFVKASLCITPCPEVQAIMQEGF